jgi:CRP-like cAMP-binding protein
VPTLDLMMRDATGARPQGLAGTAVHAGPGQRPVRARPSVVVALLQAFEPVRLPRAALEPLADAAQVREVAPGCAVLDPARACAAAWLLLDGQVCVGRQQGPGATQLVRTVSPGQWIDAASCWLDVPTRHDAWVPPTARAPAWIAEIPRAEVHAALAHGGELARAWLVVLASQVRRWSEATDDLMHQGAESRCARWLLAQSQAEHGAAGPLQVELHERKRVIAAQLGITPETFSRVLRELTRKALIQVEGYHVRLLDPGALSALATA